MNRIVVKEIAAGALPRDLRGGIEPSRRVEVTVRELAPAEQEARARGRFAQFLATRRANYTDIDAIIAHVRTVRDGDG